MTSFFNRLPNRHSSVETFDDFLVGFPADFRKGYQLLSAVRHRSAAILVVAFEPLTAIAVLAMLFDVLASASVTLGWIVCEFRFHVECIPMLLASEQKKPRPFLLPHNEDTTFFELDCVSAVWYSHGNAASSHVNPLHLTITTEFD